ncbi:hypothetical protein OEZ85_012750 [Tetradesmus obliquus]|uniref:Peptidase C1A papain C-terminal domain-containing protein n=1 Tax=Tetradesmus obliquus TaxID=3088 RepID=A0ABY8U450_TETOB|nr:hypothetical protein OEZ85_012750 [Tetradesmus obliquus]
MARLPLLALLLLLAAASALCAKPWRPAVKGITPVTKFAPFKQANTNYLTFLRNQTSTNALTMFLSASKQGNVKVTQQRVSTFQSNLKRIADFNKQNTKLKYILGPNKFTAMTTSERAKFVSLTWKGKPCPAARARAEALQLLKESVQLSAADVEEATAAAYAAAEQNSAASRATAQQQDIPDWSSVLPAVKAQDGESGLIGQCRAGWAFASTALAEAGSFINTGIPISLAEQQLVDCVSRNGCAGGSLDTAFQYMIDTGLTTSDMYPYSKSGEQGECQAGLTAVSKLASFSALPAKDEAAMLQALQNGPIAVTLSVDSNFFEYTGGVYASDSCTKPIACGGLSHAMTIIGAGRDEELGVDYWLLRNSWGEAWGEGGTMRILRNLGGAGMCNIAAAPYQYNTTVARIQLDNAAILTDPKKQIADNTQLTISTCNNAVWSGVYGVYKNWNEANAMVAIPTELVCPEGEYAVQFYVKPSKWYTPGQFINSTWVGTIIMTCSGGSQYTIDAQPGFNAGWADGAVSQSNVASGLSCPTVTASPTDNWQTVAVKQQVGVTELMRSNPNVTAAVTTGTKLFIPPCNNGVLQNTQTSKPGPKPFP